MMLTTSDILSLISPSTIFWLLAIMVAAITGLFVGSAGRLNRNYDADSEEIIRDLARRKVPGKHSEPDLVLIAPRELRLVKKA